MMLMVLYGAVGSLCLTPVARLVQFGGSSVAAMVVYGLLAVPLCWTLMTFMLVRRGPVRDAIVAVLLIVPVLTGLMGIVSVVAFYAFRAAGSAAFAASFPSAFMTQLVLILVGMVLAVALGVLLRVVTPRRCPACGRYRVWPRSDLDIRLFSILYRGAGCVACGTRYYRTQHGLTAWPESRQEPWPFEAD